MKITITYADGRIVIIDTPQDATVYIEPHHVDFDPGLGL